MTQEHIVNRVAQPHVEREGELLDQPKMFGIPSEEFPKEPMVVHDWSMSPAALDAGHVAENPEVDGTPAPEIVEQPNDQSIPDDNIGNTLEPPDTVYSPSAELISSLLKERAKSLELDEFRIQVIAAFRHLGLDVRKHFGA